MRFPADSGSVSRSFAGVLVVISLTVAPGCSKGGRKEVNPVQGQILVNATPASGALITFHPVAGSPTDPRPSAQADEQGRFNLTTYANGDGAPEGEYEVAVTWFRPIATPGLSDGDTNTRNGLPSRYANPATSQLRATVSQGENVLPTFRVRDR